MDYNEALNIVLMVVKQHRNGYHISQQDYNNYLDALAVLELVKQKVQVTK